MDYERQPIDISQALAQIDITTAPPTTVELYRGTDNPDQREVVLNGQIVQAVEGIATPQSIKGLVQLYRAGVSNIATELTNENLLAVAEALVIGEPQTIDPLEGLITQIEDIATRSTGETRAEAEQGFKTGVFGELASRLADPHVPIREKEELVIGIEQLDLETIKAACRENPSFLLQMLENVEEFQDPGLRSFIMGQARRQAEDDEHRMKGFSVVS